ncbi:MAG: LON peptidase substrate-binding domain-containing protein [Acidimicrobiales bacterium]
MTDLPAPSGPIEPEPGVADPIEEPGAKRPGWKQDADELLASAGLPALAPMPMFPLGTVLFPHLLLPLHVFEPRYRAMTRDCLAGSREFGVVLIERGIEVGGGESRFEMATVARIVEEAEFADGRWALLARGERRARVSCWLPDDPYPVALVETLPDIPLNPNDVGILAKVERVVRRGLAMAAELAEETTFPATVELADDPEVAAWQLCAVAPISTVDQHKLLAMPTPTTRLGLLLDLVTETNKVLAIRLAGG